MKALVGKIINYIRQWQRPVKVQVKLTSPDKRLVGKRILVTGGTGGLGRAMAARFVAEGAKVLITGRNEDKLKQISSELGCEMLPFDLTHVDGIGSFVKRVIDQLGGIDCLVNNAGVSLHETFQTVTSEGFDQQVNTNLKAPFFLSQQVLAYMEANGIKGQVLFISSDTGETADIRPYGLTKAAVNSLVRGLAYLYIKKGIRVNALAPGVTASEMTGFDSEGDLSCSFTQNGRVYLPEEMAEVAAFLLSDASGCISGQIVTCNNGNTVNARWKT